MRVEKVLKKLEEDFREFGRIPKEKRRSNRPDLHAFMLLDELVPDTDNIIDTAEHDFITIGVDILQLGRAGATKEQLLELVRCGIYFDEDLGCLCMFV